MKILTRRKPALWKEILIILILKIIVLFVIWKVCFSDPVAKHLTVSSMQHQILSTVRGKRQ
ncbi:MAG: hypothetical protein A3F10_05310 [Coxiella sp. RIFCSPHIGHO2_12_FULL_42_15]|nr:MAG: hypothetical protein A3F10_05310 [Coxiella sp. RIFCSPHIGHO2_12_FULL_42_15]